MLERCCSSVATTTYVPQAQKKNHFQLSYTVEFAYNGTLRGFQKTAVIDKLTL